MTSTSAVIITTDVGGQTSQLTQYTVVQTVVPASTIYATTVVTSTESPTGIAGLQSNLGSSSGGGLSTGAKAGIGAGVGVAVIVAAIVGALYAMRRRKRNNEIADNDRYTPSTGPSMIGGFAGKTLSDYTESDMRSYNSPPMREANPLDRYATPGGVASHRASLPPKSQVSDISSASGGEQYRPGPGMPAVVEASRFQGVNELPENNTYPNDHMHPAYAATAASNPFQPITTGGRETPSLYSDDGDGDNQPSPERHRQVSPQALQHTTSNGSMQGYRGANPEESYYTRQQPQKPVQYNPSHNF